MDTIVIGNGLPFVLAFLDHDRDTVVQAWTEWATTGQLVHARHTNPQRDALVLIRPSACTTVQFIVNEHAGRKMVDRGLYSQPHLQYRADAADLPPEHNCYWTLQPSGFSAELTTMDDGTRGIRLGNWEPGRI
ncbi:hypothetical protein [Mycolicibacterium llatzerense]|uniref:hypothetical protein n=1 Tax=Mycolicibacterium llatzerense TaxID=280871 RepID=UPI0031D69DBF